MMNKRTIKLAKKKHVKITATGWGNEIEIHNGDGYCGRVLDILTGQKCSLHYHLNKKETFYVLSGRINIDLSFDLHSETITLEEGDSIDIPQFVMHRFVGLVNSQVLEISTEDLGEDDLVRVKQGSTQMLKTWNADDDEFIQWESKVRRILGK